MILWAEVAVPVLGVLAPLALLLALVLVGVALGGLGSMHCAREVLVLEITSPSLAATVVNVACAVLDVGIFIDIREILSFQLI